MISGPFASPFAIPDPAQTAGGQVVSAKRSRSGAKAVATCGGKNGSDAAILLGYPVRYPDLISLLCGSILFVVQHSYPNMGPHFESDLYRRPIHPSLNAGVLLVVARLGFE